MIISFDRMGYIWHLGKIVVWTKAGLLLEKFVTHQLVFSSSFIYFWQFQFLYICYIHIMKKMENSAKSQKLISIKFICLFRIIVSFKDLFILYFVYMTFSSEWNLICVDLYLDHLLYDQIKLINSLDWMPSKKKNKIK